MKHLKLAAHIHSDFSDDCSWPLRKIVRHLRWMGFDGALLCEHDRTMTDDKWRRIIDTSAEISQTGFLVVPGIEYQDPTHTIHVPVYGAAPFFGRSPQIQGLLEHARQHKALSVLAHPVRRDAFQQVDQSWFELLCGVEVWNRKYDGLQPNRWALDITSKYGLTPFTALDFHGPRQFFPLCMITSYTAGTSARMALAETGTAHMRPAAFGVHPTALSTGPAGTITSLAEGLRRRCAPKIRHLEIAVRRNSTIDPLPHKTTNRHRERRGYHSDGDDCRILVVPNTVFFPPYIDELPALTAAGGLPRAWINDIDGNIEYLDQRLLTNPPSWLKLVYRRLPMWLVQVLEAFRVGKDYDIVFLWSVTNVTLILGLLSKLSRRRLPIVTLLTRVSEPKKAWLLKRVHTQFEKIILPPIVQRQFAVEHLGVPPDKLVGLPWTLDTQFWRVPEPAPQRSMVCAAGGEMRDYATLVHAMDGLDIPCHIAGVLDADRPDWWNSAEDCRTGQTLPANVSCGTMPPADLRSLYARSRIVIVPLHPTNSDNGITCMNEAWAMGCAVIVSAVEGQKGAFNNADVGLWVPPGDVDALRRAIVTLWNDPARADSMGRSGLQRVRQNNDHHVFANGIGRVFEEVARSCRPLSRQ